MFANSLSLIADCDIVHAHIFPFSPRTGTPAARMPQVAPPEVRARAATLRARAAEHRAAWLASLVETEQDVLIERPGDRGHAGNFAEVRLADTHTVGSVVRIAITGVDNNHLTAAPIRAPAKAGAQLGGARDLPQSPPTGPRPSPGYDATFNEKIPA